MHNFFNENIPSNSRLSEEGSKELIILAIDEYLKSEGASVEDRQSTAILVTDILTNDKQYAYTGEVTRMQATFIATLERIFYLPIDFDKTISLIDSLEEQAYELLSEEEIELVLFSTTIAKSESSYWFENLEKSASNERTACVKSWKRVAKSGVTSGLGAVLGCAGASLFTGPLSPAAWGGCVVAGVVGGAVQEAATQCLDDMIPHVTGSIQECISGQNVDIEFCGKWLNYEELLVE